MSVPAVRCPTRGLALGLAAARQSLAAQLGVWQCRDRQRSSAQGEARGAFQAAYRELAPEPGLGPRQVSPEQVRIRAPQERALAAALGGGASPAASGGEWLEIQGLGRRPVVGRRQPAPLVPPAPRAAPAERQGVARRAGLRRLRRVGPARTAERLPGVLLDQQPTPPLGWG